MWQTESDARKSDKTDTEQLLDKVDNTLHTFEVRLEELNAK